MSVATGAGRVDLDADQFVATTAIDVAAREGQAALLGVRGLHAAGVVAEVERDPALAGLVAAHAVGTADQLEHLVHLHADLQLGELAAGRRVADDLAIEAAVL